MFVECERGWTELVLFTFNTARERAVEADHVAARMLTVEPLPSDRLNKMPRA